MIFSFRVPAALIAHTSHCRTHPVANAQYGDVSSLYVNAMMYTRGGPYLAGMAAALVTLSPPPSSEPLITPLVPSEVQTACT